MTRNRVHRMRYVEVWVLGRIVKVEELWGLKSVEAEERVDGGKILRFDECERRGGRPLSQESGVCRVRREKRGRRQ